jgi:NAD(P)-dependent dehydrogenase (short-subunit alcohol dehydrogenase family)
VQSAGGKALAIRVDLVDPAAPAQVVRQVLEAFGAIDILVNNAGIGSSSSPRPVVDFDDEFWNKTLALNLTAPYKLSKAVLPIMLQKKWGRMINIASINGKLPAIHGAAYTASKHGLLGLTRTLALEVLRDGITVNAICPGPVKTEMNERRVEYDAKRLGLSMAELESRLTPIGRRLEPEEIVPMALLLASEESAAITGQAFNVCGGVAT